MDKSIFSKSKNANNTNSIFGRYTPITNNVGTKTTKKNTDNNKGGFLGGVGYALGKLGTGISSAKALNRGNEISKNQDYTNAVVGMAEKFVQYETDNNTGKEA